MVKIIRNTSNAEDLDKVANKSVCDVIEYQMDTIFGSMKAWKGSTEEEYFSIIFSGGTITMCVSEREMLMGESTLPVGMVTELREALTVSETDMDKGREMSQKYMDEKLSDDVNNITFGDIIEALKWKIKDGAKISFDLLVS